MKQKLLIGRHEWCALRDLKVPAIKAKVDTGAKTSALHAFNIRTSMRQGKKRVFFDVHPLQGDNETTVACSAWVSDERYVLSSNGHKERRYVIQTRIVMGGQTWDIELTLSNRDPLRYRMLIGREAMNHRVLVDPGQTLILEKKTKRELTKLYRAAAKTRVRPRT